MPTKNSSPLTRKAATAKATTTKKKTINAKKKAASTIKKKTTPENVFIAPPATARELVPAGDTTDRSISRSASLPMRASEPVLAVTPPAALAAAEATPVPNTQAECLIWMGQSFHVRVLLAISDWAGEPVATLTATMTLGELAKGPSWGAGQQARLVNATNSRAVFFPFASTMLPPSVLLPAATKVAEWERVAWRQQDPQTPCFVFGG